ncbi:hypothetical protein [Fusobacterium sp. SYSU M8D902]|uniref:hypothetical protein n=1 Tax=Fusobacterium sp. SYSU M8D902 TaxID=3159562 RepID=UPI0032E4A28E
MKELNQRICLEKKWSNNCVKNGIPLPRKDGRVLSISPTAYYYYTGVNADGYDSIKYKELSKKVHKNERGEIEKEVLLLISKNRNYLGYYFFELKNELINLSYDEFNKVIKYSIKKDKYNRVQRLLRKWEQLSHKYHYKITGGIRRINDRLQNN